MARSECASLPRTVDVPLTFVLLFSRYTRVCVCADPPASVGAPDIPVYSTSTLSSGCSITTQRPDIISWTTATRHIVSHTWLESGCCQKLHHYKLAQSPLEYRRDRTFPRIVPAYLWPVLAAAAPILSLISVLCPLVSCDIAFTAALHPPL
ncbi:hypothetical protein J6590_019679 [Homalodisca vitripennis]|nr:hypothetical protein J6590_019679 [Homalodisca vitripennis]